MRLVGLTLALVVAGGQACTFLEGADQHISLMVSSIIILMVHDSQRWSIMIMLVTVVLTVILNWFSFSSSGTGWGTFAS